MVLGEDKAKNFLGNVCVPLTCVCRVLCQIIFLWSAVSDRLFGTYLIKD